MEKTTKLLLVEDDIDIANLLVHQLESHGFQVKHAAQGHECLPLASSFAPELILMDMNLGDVTGLQVCGDLEQNSETGKIPVVFLSSLDTDAVIIDALERRGVYDFVSKRSSIDILVARIRNILRLVQREESTSGDLTCGNLRLDPITFRLWVDGTELSLTVSEFRLLQMFMEVPDRVFDRQEIILKVHGSNYPVTERSVDTLVKSLRQKLGAAGENIETVRGAGYRIKP